MVKHAASSTREYKAWCRMKQNCLDRNYPGYKNYGAKGVRIDPDWLDFPTFLKDMGEMSDHHNALIRKDLMNDFSKHNCEWGFVPRGAKKKEGKREKKAPIKRRGRFKQPKSVFLILEEEHYNHIARQAMRKSLECNCEVTANDIMREALQNAFPLAKMFDMFGNKI